MSPSSPREPTERPDSPRVCPQLLAHAAQSWLPAAPRSGYPRELAPEIILWGGASRSEERRLWVSACAILGISWSNPSAQASRAKSVELVVLIGQEARSSLSRVRTHYPQALLVGCFEGEGYLTKHLNERGVVQLSNTREPAMLLAWLRQRQREAAAGPVISRPVARLDRLTGTLSVAGDSIPLHPREVELLLILRAYSVNACCPRELCRKLLHRDCQKARRLMWQHLHQLRKKLGSYAAFIECRRGVGYRCLMSVLVVDVTQPGEDEQLLQRSSPRL